MRGGANYFELSENARAEHIQAAYLKFRKMFPLAFVAGWLQGYWWGFISRNYVVWSTFFLMNVFIALKGSHFWILFEFTAAGVVQCGGR